MTGFGYGETVYRDRRPMVASLYNPSRETTAGDWSTFDTIEIEGVYVAEGSEVARQDAVRTESAQSMSLYSKVRSIDVAIGDRIRRANGDAYLVQVRPAGDVNPFTGKDFGVEIPLVGFVG